MLRSTWCRPDSTAISDIKNTNNSLKNYTDLSFANLHQKEHKHN